MHNGGIAEFHKIKRRLQSYLPDDLFEMVTGNTGMYISALDVKSYLHKKCRFAMGFCVALV